LRILSINLAERRQLDLGGALVETGFFKLPARASHSELCYAGLVGDFRSQARSSPDQALCAYPHEHYAFFETVLGRPLPPGSFGENLTVSFGTEHHVRIGDVLAGDQVRLQVTGPRTPCKKLNRALDARVTGFALETVRLGYYLRVLVPGSMRHGEDLKVVDSDPNSPTIAEFVEGALVEFWQPERLRALLQSSKLTATWAAAVREKLGSAERAQRWAGPRAFRVQGVAQGSTTQLELECAHGLPVPPLEEGEVLSLLFRSRPLEARQRLVSLPVTDALSAHPSRARYLLRFPALPAEVIKTSSVWLIAPATAKTGLVSSPPPSSDSD
jgi:MOSC domain-containing protein YiiM